MSMSEFRRKTSDVLESLQVNADAHRQEGDCHDDVVSSYVQSLLKLKDLLEQCRVGIDDSGICVQDELQWSRDEIKPLLKGLMPDLLTGVTCHTGFHYWTSKKSRTAAKETLLCLLKVCHCRSVSELLIGTRNVSLSGPSPYSLLIETLEPLDLSLDQTDLSLDQPVISSLDQPVNLSLDQPVSSLDQPVNSSLDQPVNLSLDQPVNSSLDQSENSSLDQPVDSSLDQSVNSKSTNSREDTVLPSTLFPHGILKDTLAHLKGKLQRGRWKDYPNAKHTLLWCLKFLKHPYVSKYCDSFLPALLLLLDDHEDSAELVQFGRAEVIYESVKSMLYFNEVEIINSLHPCLIHLLPIIEGPPPRKIDTPRKPGKIDEVFSVLLHSMDTESKIAVRKAYIRHVSGYIELLGIYSVRYISRLLSVIYHYIEYPDYCGEETRINSLKTLCCLMKHVWPRIPAHSESIMKSLLKLISDLCPEDDVITDKSEVLCQLNLIGECFLILGHCHPAIRDSCEKLFTTTKHRGLKQCLQPILEHD